MPAKSEKQFKLMAGVANGMKPKGFAGPSKEVAEKFVKETPSKQRSLFMSKKKKKNPFA